MKLSVFLVLLLFFVSFSIATHETESTYDYPTPRNPPPPPGHHPSKPHKDEKCHATVSSIEKCVREAIKRFLRFEFDMGPSCCDAIIKVSNTCYKDIYNYRIHHDPLFALWINSTGCKINTD